jgi:hypothetical protein
VEKHPRWRVEFDPIAGLFARHGKGAGAVWTLRELGALSESERMCLESYDIVKGNVDRSDDSLETVIKPRNMANPHPRGHRPTDSPNTRRRDQCDG